MPNGFVNSDYAVALRALNRFGHLISLELTARGSVCEGSRFLWRIPSAKRGLPTLQFTNMGFERCDFPAHPLDLLFQFTDLKLKFAKLLTH